MFTEEVLRITFKNVKQGDCIILEWKNDNDEWEIGMIDCNAVSEVMPNITAHIAKNPAKKLSFLILSHPHNDHYSGISEIIDFCHTQEIVIERIFDTCSFEPHNFVSGLPLNAKQTLFSSFPKSKYDLPSLEQLFKKFEPYRNEKKYKQIQNPGKLLENKNLTMYFLSPDTEEIREYINQTFKANDKQNIEVKNPKPDANLLSTILLIYANDWQVVLTSDATILTFDRMTRGNSWEKPYLNRKLIVAQAPHHGSVKNHNPIFWDDYITEETSTVISSGKNNHHQHPHHEVVEYFDKKVKRVYETNFVHGYANYYTSKKKDTNHLMAISEIDTQLVFIDDDLNNSFVPDADDCGEQLIKVWANGDYEIFTNP